MPLYEYECQACHRRLEKIQKFSDPELTVCPHCSGRLERTITAPAFQFAGGGWFADGYGSKKNDPGGSSSSEASSSGAGDAPSAATPASAPAPATAPSAAPAAPSAPSSSKS
jgi:putative FmdB family regulatory protein